MRLEESFDSLVVGVWAGLWCYWSWRWEEPWMEGVGPGQRELDVSTRQHQYHMQSWQLLHNAMEINQQIPRCLCHRLSECCFKTMARQGAVIMSWVHDNVTTQCVKLPCDHVGVCVSGVTSSGQCHIVNIEPARVWHRSIELRRTFPNISDY